VPRLHGIFEDLQKNYGTDGVVFENDFRQNGFGSGDDFITSAEFGNYVRATWVHLFVAYYYLTGK
jgi:hypothetical protein